jgi:hypothetical protein
VIWLLGGIVVGFALGLAVSLARSAKQADEHAAALAVRHVIAKCDFPLCREDATSTLDINGTVVCSCEKHPALLVRLHAGESFEAFGVPERRVIA